MSSKEVLNDDKQDHVSPCTPDTFQSGEQEHARVESPERALRSSVMYYYTQDLGSGLIISNNDDDSESSFVGWTWDRSRKEQRNGGAGSPS